MVSFGYHYVTMLITSLFKSTREFDATIPRQVPQWLDAKFSESGGGDMPRGMWVSALRSGWEKHPEMSLCPSAIRPNPEGKHGSYDMAHIFSDYKEASGDEAIAEASSYGMNCWAYNTHADLQRGKEAWHWKSIDRIKQASEVPLFLDSMWRGGGPYWEDPVAIMPPKV